MPCQAAVRLADGVDVLVHEATQCHDLEHKANERGHSSTTQAAKIAKESGAKKLVITHISPRYQLQDNPSIIEECRAIFPNSDIATDFYQVNII